MRSLLVPIVVLLTLLAASAPAFAQVRAPAPGTPKVATIEPGLEKAIQWKWWVVPSVNDKEWGLTLPEANPAPAAPATSPASAPTTAPTATPGETKAKTETVLPAITARPATYQVQKGDALAKIGKKFGLTVEQLKAFNNRTKDTIRIGEELKIPTLEEAKALTPAPPPELPKPAKDTATAAKKASPAATPAPALTVPAGNDDLLLQVFLDREQFSTGAIDGNLGPMFDIAARLYCLTHEDAANMDALRTKAHKEVVNPLTIYTLRDEDFRFIDPSSASNVPERKSKAKGKAEAKLPDPTYEQLIAAKALVYRTSWEFIAERFHCDETFLRQLNPTFKGNPAIGAGVRVPNVIPFEIEKVFESPLQPEATPDQDPAQKVTAAIIDLARLEMSKGGKVVATMPIAMARPDLRGRGAWTILDIIPRPRLATKQELKATPKPPAAATTVVAPGFAAVPAPAPVVETPHAPALATEEYLAAGPNNPIGVAWINLAKAKSTEPLPYGLHGTSIPSRMKTQEGIGGIRLANWDLVRAARLLPRGTPLQWTFTK